MCLAVQTGLTSGCSEGLVEQEGVRCSSIRTPLSLGARVGSECGHGLPAEGAVWAHPPFISSLYFGPRLLRTCLQWFPTPKEQGHRGLREGEGRRSAGGRSAYPWGKLWLPPSALWGHPGTHSVWCQGGGGLVGCSWSQSRSSYTAELEVNTELP